MSRRTDYDVIIVGAGMVGAALACALADSPLRVALLERRPPSPPGDAVGLRVSAIAPASQRILQRLVTWPESHPRLSPYREMRVWDASGGHGIHFDSAELGTPQLGWIVENQLLQFSLWRRAAAHTNIDLLCPAGLNDVTWDDDCARLRLDDGVLVTSTLLIGADGARSRVRELAGIGLAQRNYRQSAIVAIVATARPHRETAWQCFLPTGPLAFLPLADGRCSIVWSTRTELAEALLALDDAAFNDRLGAAFGHTLGAVRVASQRVAFPLYLQHTRRYVQPGLALIGDAAHVVHPLAGQGVNLGLLDAASLAQVLQQAHARCRPLGTLTTLRRYERWRRSENELMLAAMDGIERLFDNALPPLAWLRRNGLALSDRLTPLKRLLAERAMGLTGDLPTLARPDSAL